MSKNCARLLTYAALLFLPTVAIAAAEVAGSIQINPSPVTLNRGDTAALTITLRNTGDQPLDVAFSGFSYYVSGPGSTVFPAASALTPPCRLDYFEFDPRPGEPALAVGTIFFAPTPLAPGESRTCVIDLLVSDQARNLFEVSFSFGAFSGAQVAPMSAVSVRFFLGDQVAAVPMLSFEYMVFLMSCLLGIGAEMARRSIQEHCATK